MHGTVKRIKSDKGFGFLIGDDGIERFFHMSALEDMRFDELREGQAVRFEDEPSEKGPRATSICCR